MQEGASEADLNALPKYKFHLNEDVENPNVSAGGRMVPIDTGSGYLANERVLLMEDAVSLVELEAFIFSTSLHIMRKRFNIYDIHIIHTPY